MDLLKMSRSEALAVLDDIKKQCSGNVTTSAEQDFFVEQIEDLLERLVINNIRERQGRLKQLHTDRLGYRAVWGRDALTPGCQSCLKGRWTQIRSSATCNAACPFCYYHNRHDDFLAANRFTLGGNRDLLSARDIELFFELQGNKVDGVAWVYYEPLMDVEKILPVLRVIHEMGYHQWLYTNGLAATPEVLARLAAAGLDEIRFNLAASNCSEEVIARMKIARDLFPHLCIESPMYTDFFNIFMGKRERILATGVEQINFAELHLNNYNLDSMRQEGPLYTFHHGYISPIKSRQLTYTVMATAEREGWENISINDCSNELKFRRGAAHQGDSFGSTSYHTEVRYRMRVWKTAVEQFDLWAAAALPDVV